jgi:hypothetical protein
MYSYWQVCSVLHALCQLPWQVFPCFFLICKTNTRVYLTKTEHGPHYS